MSNINNKKPVTLNDIEFIKYKKLHDIIREFKVVLENRGAINVDIDSSLNTFTPNIIKGRLNFDGQYIEFNFIPHREGITDFNMFIDGKSVYEGKVMKWGMHIIDLILRKRKKIKLVDLSDNKKEKYPKK
ncbi:MAG: hypothetical protein IJT14_00330 [Rickettsiales bacterium]|nr:hypothetical protein [Rickettsiales bacterium]